MRLNADSAAYRYCIKREALYLIEALPFLYATPCRESFTRMICQETSCFVSESAETSGAAFSKAFFVRFFCAVESISLIRFN